jgi:hypothetical protein
MQKKGRAIRLLRIAGYVLDSGEFVWSGRRRLPDGWPKYFSDDDDNAVERAIEFGLLEENNNATTGGRRTRRARRSA